MTAAARVQSTGPYLGGEASLLDREAEKRGVEEILEALKDDEKAQMPDPGMPVRHLRAEKGDVAKAIEKLKAAVRWRKEFDVAGLVKASSADGDEKYKQMLEKENATGKIYVRGYDKDGRAFIFMNNSRENTHNVESNMKHLVWNIEKAIACTRKRSVELGAAVPLEKVNMVIDFDGFTLAGAPPMNVSKFTLDVMQKHYPERMYRIYAVNPPFVFKAFWNIIRPFIDPTTKEKIIFCSNKKDIERIVSRVADPTTFDPVGGGTSTVKFDSKTYVRLPMDICFDEKQQQVPKPVNRPIATAISLAVGTLHIIDPVRN